MIGRAVLLRPVENGFELVYSKCPKFVGASLAAHAAARKAADNQACVPFSARGRRSGSCHRARPRNTRTAALCMRLKAIAVIEYPAHAKTNVARERNLAIATSPPKSCGRKSWIESSSKNAVTGSPSILRRVKVFSGPPNHRRRRIQGRGQTVVPLQPERSSGLYHIVGYQLV